MKKPKEKIKITPKEFFSVWKDVFGKWSYLITAIVIFLLFYSMNVLIRNFSSVIAYLNQIGLLKTFKFFLTLILGFNRTVTTSSFISLIAIGILFGILISLIIYKTKMLKDVSGKGGIFATTGIFLGILAPGCAACGIGLLSVFGISAAAIAFLPFDGLELSILAIGILSFSVLKVTKSIKRGIVCEI